MRGRRVVSRQRPEPVPGERTAAQPAGAADAADRPDTEPLAHTCEGLPFSERYGDVYASRAGAAGQAREVFLRGCGLLGEQAAWHGRRQFVVLETGFGLGTNFLATWQAWRADPKRPEILHYVALELHPVRAQDLLRECPEPAWRELAADLAAQWPPAMRGLHPLHLDGGRVRLLLALGDALTLLRQLELGADAMFLDGFAPSRNPRMWSRELMLEVARVGRPAARVASYTVAREVREALQAAGFEVQRLPGYGGKAQRLQGVLRSPPADSRARAPRASAGRAMVIGAGLAGSACAEALAGRGWSVQVLDAHGAAAGTSGLAAGLAHLRPAAAEDRLARLTRAGVGWLRAGLPAGPRVALSSGDGVLMAAGEPRRAALQAQAADWPPQFLRRLGPADAADCAGLAQAPPAWWTAGTSVAAGALCAAWMDHPRIELRAGLAVQRLRHDPDSGTWQALDGDGHVLAQAESCVLACAADGARLLHASGLHGPHGVPRLRSQRGQGFVVPASALPGLRGLRCGVMAGSYALPLPPAAVAARGLDARQAWLFVGATHEHPQQPELSRQQVWEHVGDGLRAWMGTASWPACPPPQASAFRGERAVAGDRLPLAGEWPHAATGGGLYLSLAMGSRGLLLSALAAQCIVSRIEGEPAPLERDLLEAIDPLRPALRRNTLPA